MKYMLCAYNFNNTDGFYLDIYIETDSAEEAIQAWFQLQTDHKSCVDLNTEKKEYADSLIDWACKNIDKIRQWYQQYSNPYKYEYLEERILSDGEHFDCGSVVPFVKG